MDEVRQDVGWQPIESAPRDGTVFIARNADRHSFGSWPMLRRVRYVYQEDGWTCVDMGAWLKVLPIEPDYDEGADTPVGLSVPFALAPDELNTSVRYEWMPLPLPPGPHPTLPEQLPEDGITIGEEG